VGVTTDTHNSENPSRVHGIQLVGRLT